MTLRSWRGKYLIPSLICLLNSSFLAKLGYHSLFECNVQVDCRGWGSAGASRSSQREIWALRGEISSSKNPTSESWWRWLWRRRDACTPFTCQGFLIWAAAAWGVLLSTKWNILHLLFFSSPDFKAVDKQLVAEAVAECHMPGCALFVAAPAPSTPGQLLPARDKGCTVQGSPLSWAVSSASPRECSCTNKRDCRGARVERWFWANASESCYLSSSKNSSSLHEPPQAGVGRQCTQMPGFGIPCPWTQGLKPSHSEVLSTLLNFMAGPWI